MLRALLPRWFARQYGRELLRAHVDAAGGAAHARGLRFWLRLTHDVLITAVQLRSERSPSSQTTPIQSDYMKQQLVYALRTLRRAPGFSLAVVLTLGLGMGATATLFTVLDRLLFSPPEHVQNADELRRINVHGLSFFMKTVGYRGALSWPDYVDLKGVKSLKGIAAYSPMRMTFDRAGASQRVKVELASASYFPLLGVRPAAGRFFGEDEDAVGAATPVAVLSHGFWQRELGGDHSALGRTIALGKGRYTIVGIAPARFTGVNIAPVDVWLPIQTAYGIQNGEGWYSGRSWHWFGAIARVDLAAEQRASTEATASYRAGRAAVKGQDPNAEIVLSPLSAARGPTPVPEVKVAQALGGLAIMVLLIACANVTNLLLARAVQRRRVLAIQTAIGLGRGRLVVQQLLESLLLAGMGGLLAIVVTRVTAPALFRTLLPNAELATNTSLRLLAFIILAILLAAALTGLLPAFRSTRFDVLEALRTSRESRRSTGIRRALLFGQAALCAVLLIGAGLFLRSLQHAQSFDLGVDPNTVAVEFEMNDGTRFGTPVTAASYAALERIRALPMIASASVTQLPQFQGFNGITLMTATDSITGEGNGPFYHSAAGGYFEAVGLRVLRGRAITDADDRAGAPRVAVLSENLARRVFGTRAAVGECLYVASQDGKRAPCTEVVGIVENLSRGPREGAAIENVYLPPHHPELGEVSAGFVMAKVRGDVTTALAEIRTAAKAAATNIRLVEANPLSHFLEPQLRSWRLGAVLLSAFAILALLVAAAGIYSTLAFDVAQRRYEFGVRSALGASGGSIVRAATIRAIAVCGSGVIAGLGIAYALARAAASMFFQVSALEPDVYAAVIATLGLSVIAAAALPAWRAVRVDPREALRTD